LHYTGLEQFSVPFFHPPSINDMTSHSRAADDESFENKRGIFSSYFYRLAESFGFNSPNQNRKGTEFSNNRDGDGIVRSFEESVVVSAPGKDPAIKHTLSCSLEELYQGATKTVKITRQVADRRG